MLCKILESESNDQSECKETRHLMTNDALQNSFDNSLKWAVQNLTFCASQKLFCACFESFGALALAFNSYWL